MRPRGWVLLLAAIAGVALTASLGRWQLGRAAQKLAMQAQLDAQAALPALSNAELNTAAPLQRRVVLRGAWLSAQTVFLDNRPMDGQPGFFVVTPLRLAPDGRVLLVQRGWLPRHRADRTQLPPLETPAGEVSVHGRLIPAPSRLYQLGQAGDGAIRQNLDPIAFGAETGLTLLPFTVLQTGPEPTAGSLRRNWPAPDLGLQKHYGYAFQWFALSALILGLYVWFQILRPRRHKRLGA